MSPKKKLWSKSIGERGCRVRLYEARADAPLMRSIYIGGKENRRSLGHKDRERAVREGYELLARLQREEELEDQEDLTLGVLHSLYVESPVFLDKKCRTQRDDRRRLERVVTFIGPMRPVGSLSESDVRRFAEARRRGDKRLLRVQPGVAVRERAVHSDLVTLQTMLNWAAIERDRHGRRLITDNPLRGVKLPREKNPRRPLITHDEYLQLLGVADRVDPLLKLALVVAEGTGRRLGSWRHLQWSDIDWEGHTVHWREAFDKKGYDDRVPASVEVIEALAEARRQRGVIGQTWVFPAPKDPSMPCDRHLLDNWLRRAYTEADLKPQEGGLWHPFRRKWVTERKHLPVVDLAAVGGWRDPMTPQRIYQRTDSETMKLVAAAPTQRLMGR